MAEKKYISTLEAICNINIHFNDVKVNEEDEDWIDGRDLKFSSNDVEDDEDLIDGGDLKFASNDVEDDEDLIDGRDLKFSSNDVEDVEDDEDLIDGGDLKFASNDVEEDEDWIDGGDLKFASNDVEKRNPFLRALEEYGFIIPTEAEAYFPPTEEMDDDTVQFYLERFANEARKEILNSL